MDEVDRLFECFKCGISPPESAIRERKKRKLRAKQAGSKEEVSLGYPEFPSSGSAEKVLAGATDSQLSLQKHGTTTVKSSKVNNGKQISPIIFYGTPHGVPPKRPARLLRLLHEIRIDLNEQNIQGEEIWATFPRQDEAIKYARETQNVHIFSYQDHMSGQRRFLVSTYRDFWQRYRSMNPKFRHHYEVIQEGLPCHLYFDLEFGKRENVEKNGDEMVDQLVSAVFDALLNKYSIQGSHDWIVELDSSTEEKFSRHLIIRLPKTAFKDNSHAGAFVAEVCSRICNEEEGDGRYENMFVSKDSSSPPHQLFIDTAVYSRNRCFRLPLSSKAGKSSVLQPTGRFTCKDMSEEDMFMASLICNMDFDCKNLLICKMDLDCVKALHFDIETTNDFQKQPRNSQVFIPDICATNGSRAYLMGKSPLPTLDMFIESVASIGNEKGKIRCWYLFSEYGLMVYSMSKNRYCERIGRQHKSNHVMYVVDLKSGVYYQKCYDPDCRDYRSPLRPLPSNVIPDPTVFLNGEKNATDNGDKSCSDSSPDGWWLEAIRGANKVENMQTLQVDQTWDGDDEWWMAVEEKKLSYDILF